MLSHRGLDFLRRFLPLKNGKIMRQALMCLSRPLCFSTRVWVFCGVFAQPKNDHVTIMSNTLLSHPACRHLLRVCCGWSRCIVPSWGVLLESPQTTTPNLDSHRHGHHAHPPFPFALICRRGAWVGRAVLWGRSAWRVLHGHRQPLPALLHHAVRGGRSPPGQGPAHHVAIQLLLHHVRGGPD